MKPREIFLTGCNEIAKAFMEFKSSRKGQLLRKYSEKMKIFFYEIYFHTIHINDASYINNKTFIFN